METNKTIVLPIWQCYFFEAPDNSSLTFVSVHNNETLILKCILGSQYLLGKQYGPLLCICFGIMVAIIGLIGAAANVANVFVLKILTRHSSLYWLLLILAIFDFIACSFAILTTVFLQLAVSECRLCSSREG